MVIKRIKGERGRKKRGKVLEAVRSTDEELYWGIMHDARRLFMCYTPTERITQYVNRKWRHKLGGPVQTSEVSGLINRKKWKAVRAKVEENIIRGIQEKGAEIYGQIAFYSADILKKGLAAVAREGRPMNVREMEQVSKIFERFDKVFRLEQDLPTEIIKGEITKDKVISFMREWDYLEVGSVEKVRGLPGVGEVQDAAISLDRSEWEKIEREVEKEAEGVLRGDDLSLVDDR